MVIENTSRNEECEPIAIGVAGASIFGKGNGNFTNIDMCMTFPFVAAVNSAVTARSREVSSSNPVLSMATSVSG